MLRHGWGNKSNQVQTGTNTRSRKYNPCKTTGADSRYLNILLDNYLNGMLLYRQQHKFSAHSPQSGSYFSSIKNTKLSPITLGKQFFPTVSNLEILKNANTFPRKGGGLGWRKTIDTSGYRQLSIYTHVHGIRKVFAQAPQALSHRRCSHPPLQDGGSRSLERR